MSKTSFRKYFVLLSSPEIANVPRIEPPDFAFFCFVLLLLLLLFFGRESLNYVTITDIKTVLDSHRKREFIIDHELRYLDKG